MFPNLKSLHLDIYGSFGSTKTDFLQYLKMDGTLQFLNRLHLHLEGTHFHSFPISGTLKQMSRYLLSPAVPGDPTTVLAPSGFSFLNRLVDEHIYKRAVPLPLPTTKTLAISIYYPHLLSFSKAGLSRMGALEHLMIELYVYNTGKWDTREEIDKKQTEAVLLAAKTCPSLSYVSMEMCHGTMRAGWDRDLNKPALPAIVGLSRSWAIVRKTVRKTVRPAALLLDSKEDEAYCPEGLWSQARKMAKYVRK